MPALAMQSLAAPLYAPQRRHVTRAAALSSRAAPLPCCALRSRRVSVARRGGLLRAAADPPPPSEDNEKDDGTASAFQKELQRRGINGSTAEDELLARASGKPNTPPRWASDARPTPDQLTKSRALSSEGLEGLIPRATELLRLGFGFFLPFLPFMVVFSILFTLTFNIFGADFLHGGGYYDLETAERAVATSRPPPERRMPAYIVPEALLAEPTVDRMVPFKQLEQPQQ